MSLEVQIRPPRQESPRWSPPKRRSIPLRILRGLAMYVLPLLVLGAAIAGAMRLIATAPVAERRTPQRQATPVQAEVFHRSSVNASVQAMGTVMASQSVVLQPRISGEVVKLSPKLVPGGRFEAGEFILQLDPVDYELAVSRARGQLAEAEYEIKLEQGRQVIAKREWDLLGMNEQASDLDRELALRRPHVLKMDAMLVAAKSAVRSAELNLERTTIKAPFNCMVTSESVDLGAQVSLQSQLATLVGTDEYWVQAAIPVDQLQWISFPDIDSNTGSQAVIHQKLGTGVQGEWAGQVVRLLGNLDPRGRMARVLIAVPDPLYARASQGGRLPMLLDAYVNVDIAGKPVQDVIALPRIALREGHQAWVMNDADALEIRELDIAWSGPETVLVRDGVADGERVVVSDLSAPVEGMKLRLFDDDKLSATSQSATAPSTSGQ